MRYFTARPGATHLTCDFVRGPVFGDVITVCVDCHAAIYHKESAPDLDKVCLFCAARRFHERKQ